MNEYIRKTIIARNFIKPIIKENQQTKQSGIYLFERTDEKGITFFYCGQAVNIFNRIMSHATGYQRIDKSMRKRKFKSAANPHGWEFKILEYCTKDELDEKEQFYIMQYLKAGKQAYNITYGSQGDGKEQFKEYKEPKGYRQGLQNGYEKARKEIAKLFEKNLTYSINGKPNKNKEKALDKFTAFLQGEKEN